MSKYLFVYHGGGPNPTSGYSLIEASDLDDALDM